MRFAGNKTNVSSYIAAGRAGADGLARNFAAARSQSPDYGGLGNAALKANSEVRIAASRAATQVQKAGLQAMDYVKRQEIKSDSEVKALKKKAGAAKMAGMVGAIGTIAAGGVSAVYNNKADAAEAARIAKEDEFQAKKLELLQKQIDRPDPELLTREQWEEQGMPGYQPDTPDTPDAAEAPTETQTYTSLEPPSTPSPPGVDSTPITFESVLSMAKNTGVKYPALVAAQWQLETGGTSGQGPTANNNLFAQKGGDFKSGTMEHNGSGLVSAPNESWASYETPQDAVNFLTSNWYEDSKFGPGIVSAGGTRSGAAEQLVTQGYATDPEYGTKLLKILSDRGL